MQNLRVPGESEWRSEPWCLDAEHAYGIFSGKDHSEAFKLFEEHAIGRQEDVMFMPSACFPFYFNVYMDYLLSPSAEGDSDGASCFLSLVVAKQNDIKKMDQPMFTKTIEAVNHVGQNQKYFDADLDIYGSFEDKASKSIKWMYKSFS